MTTKTMSKTQALEQLSLALREQRHLYTYRFVLDDVTRALQAYEERKVDETETIRRISIALAVYRYEMKEE